MLGRERRPRPRGALCALAGALALVGCRTGPPAPDRATISEQLVRRVGHTAPVEAPPGQLAMPPGASFDDGLTEDEAVAIALWNNAAFQELPAAT